MRAVGDESRPPCHWRIGRPAALKLLSRLFDSQDSVEGSKVLVELEAGLERNCADAFSK